MAVDGAVVGLVTELWVRNGGNSSVNGDNWSGVTSASEKSACGLDCGDDGSGIGTIVDELVADGYSVDVAPVTANSANDGVDLALETGEREDTSEQLYAVGLASSKRVRNGVAVSSVGADICETTDEAIEI